MVSTQTEPSRYLLTFPPHVPVTQVQAWLNALGGALRGKGFNAPTAALELQATNRGLTHRLVVPFASADQIVSQLRSLVPGIRVTSDHALARPSWTAAAELVLTSPSKALHIPSSEQFSTSLLASVQGLSPGETVGIQWVVTPAVPEKPVTKREETAEHGKKLKEMNLLGALRLAVSAPSDGRADHLLAQVLSAFASTRSPHTRFRRKLTLSKSALFKQIDGANGKLLYGVRVSTSELAALIGWPLGSPHVAGLPQGRTRQLSAPATVPSAGRVIGTSNFPGAERPIALSYKEAVQHLHVLGPTGTGKTTLLANMAAQDMEQGYGLVVLESKGDLFHAVLDRVPRERIKDVIVLDVNDTAMPVGFNILNHGSSGTAVDELSSLITGMYGDSGGIYAPMLLYYGLHALAATPGSTFIDLPSLLTPQGPEEAAWRDHIVGNVKNRDVRQFWQRYLSDANKERDRMAAPVHNRIWQLAVRPEIRNIIGQSASSFTFEEVLRGNKILLVNLNGVRVGQQTAALVGTLLMNAFWSAVRTVKPTKPNFLYVDEFQDFIDLPVPAADLLAKLRSFKAGLVLAHQDLDQLAKVRGLEQAVLANARSKVVFQTSSRDARVVQREFGRLVDEDDFLNLAAYEAIVRIATGDGMSTPITITTLPPSKPTGVANAVLAASRTRYGRPVAEVEAEIDARRRVVATTTKKPKLGTQRWG